jgi:hypothetical protein
MHHSRPMAKPLVLETAYGAFASNGSSSSSTAKRMSQATSALAQTRSKSQSVEALLARKRESVAARKRYDASEESGGGEMDEEEDAAQMDEQELLFRQCCDADEYEAVAARETEREALREAVAEAVRTEDALARGARSLEAMRDDVRLKKHLFATRLAQNRAQWAQRSLDPAVLRGEEAQFARERESLRQALQAEARFARGEGDAQDEKNACAESLKSWMVAQDPRRTDLAEQMQNAMLAHLDYNRVMTPLLRCTATALRGEHQGYLLFLLVARQDDAAAEPVLPFYLLIHRERLRI